ncbi:MAG: dephospho-CoA kinase [Legionella sp.]|nr:MAG: dephospho-CoA kinase [Legionella sp.]
MYCVGLTGSIASGKTTVATLFAQLGVELINADLIAKQLTTPDQPALARIIEHFGSSILDETGHLKRAQLREHIMQHPKERLWLEQLLHPLIRKKIETLIQIPPRTYYMIEIPLLTSKKDYAYLNRVLLVLAEPSLQIERIIQRDKSSIQHATNILQTQASEPVYRAVADDILMNKGSLENLQKNVLQLHHNYLKNAHDTL